MIQLFVSAAGNHSLYFFLHWRKMNVIGHLSKFGLVAISQT